MNNIFRRPITILSVIQMFRNEAEFDESFCVYGEVVSETEITLDSLCYLDEYSEFDDTKDEEILPPFVRDNNLELWFTDEIIEQVVINSLHQNKNIEDSKILEGVFYYYKHDTFLDLRL